MEAHIAVLSLREDETCPVCASLTEAGYQVHEHKSAEAVLTSLGDTEIDMIVLVADDSPETVSAAMRALTSVQVPLLVISSVQDENFVIRMLVLGADGCLCEPFGESEFLARVEAHLRRYWEWGDAEREMQAGGIVIDALSCAALVNGREIRLTPTEYRLLSRLAESSGEVVTNEDLCDHIWGFDRAAKPSSLRLYISHLRRKLEPDPHKPRFIRTKWGIGYYLEGEPADE